MPNDQKFRAGKSTDFFPLPLMNAEHGPADAPHLDKAAWVRAVGLPAEDEECYRTLEDPEAPEAPAVPADADRSRDVTKTVGPENPVQEDAPETQNDAEPKKAKGRRGKAKRPDGIDWAKARTHYARIYTRAYKLFYTVIEPVCEPKGCARVLFTLAWNYGLASLDEFKAAMRERLLPTPVTEAIGKGEKPGFRLPLPRKVEEALRDLESPAALPPASQPPTDVEPVNEPAEAAPAAPPSSRAPEEVVFLKDEPADERPSDPPKNPLRREENPPSVKDTARIIGIQFDCFLKRYGVDAALTLIENLTKRI